MTAPAATDTALLTVLRGRAHEPLVTEESLEE